MMTDFPLYERHILYPLLRAADKFYIGHTAEPIEEHLRKHNTNHDGFTGKFQDWILVYSEAHHSKQLAFARERQVKAWKVDAK